MRHRFAGAMVGLCFCGWSVTAGAAPPAVEHMVRIERSAGVGSVSLPAEPKFRIGYSSFDWVGLDAAGLAALDEAGLRYSEVVDAFELTLGGQSFDPLRAGVPQTQLQAAATAGADLRLVQFVGPTKAEWLNELQAGGAKVVQYIHPHTYVVWATPQQVEVPALEPVVRWKGEFQPAYRLLPPSLAEAGRSAGPIEFRILIARAAGDDAVSEAIRATGARVTDAKPIHEHLAVLGADLTAEQAVAVARLPGVYSVQTQPTDGGLRNEMGAQVNVNNVDGTNLALVGYRTWITAVGFDGAGVIIANVDGGVRDQHPDLINRMLPCTGGSSCGNLTTQDSHGTHTAGIMAGDGASNGLDVRGFLRGLGVAPGANLIEQRYSPTFSQPGGMSELMRVSSLNGASLSGNSWGPAGTPRGYDNDTLQVDVSVRDAQPAAAGNQAFSFVLSFMNGNGGVSSQGTPDEGKNCFTIGSTKLQNSGSGSQILQINDLSANSAHGPALDGRKIPHMVAPGCNVDSTDTVAAGYGLKCGTSMASPQVSGAVAVFIEYYRNLPDYTVDPSPAMIKAAFLAAARDLAGNRDADNGLLGRSFDSKQGWGRMDLEAVVDPQQAVRYFDNPITFENTGEEWTQTVTAEDPSAPVRLMLVWTDAPGHGLGGATPAWNNDLDLIVSDGADEYRGNQFGPQGWSIPSATADNRNNTEGVFIGPAAGSSYTVRVRASNISSDGVPGMGDATDQDFALACYNCALEPTFTLTTNPANLTICAPVDAVYNIDVGQILGFSDQVTLSLGGDVGALTHSFSANPVAPGGATVLTLSNTSAATPGEHLLSITGVAGATTRNLSLRLTAFTAAPAAASPQTPAPGAAQVGLRPIFTWTAQADAVSYDVDIATDAAFSNIVASGSDLTAPDFVPGSDLTPGATYYWRVRASNTCGDGAYSAGQSFTTRVVPAILLVDDDDNGPDVRTTYSTALQSISRDFDVWNTNDSDTEPTAANLSPYSIVIWFTGDSFGGACGPGAAGEAALATWLQTGKGLFIASQDYHYDRDRTPFMATYLGVASVTDDENQTNATAVPSNIFNGLGPFALAYPFSNFSDIMVPDATAQAAFTGTGASVIGITKETAEYRTAFFVFPFEALPTATAEQQVLARIIDWLQPEPPVLLGDMNCDGAVTVTDIAGFVLALTDPAAYAAAFPTCDIAAGDLNQDGNVTVSDIGPFVALLTGP